MSPREKVEAIAEILKRRFPNLTVKEIVNLSFEIMEVTEK